MAPFTRCVLVAAVLLTLSLSAAADQLPPQLTYRTLPTQPFDAVRTADEAEKPAVEQRQRALLEERYDLSDRPIPNVMMSAGRKPVQGGGVRVKLPRGCHLGVAGPDVARRHSPQQPVSGRVLAAASCK